MAKYRIEVNKKECIGCGACAAQCDNFVMDGDKAKPKKVVVEKLGCNKEAQSICPVEAIVIKEIK